MAGGMQSDEVIAEIRTTTREQFVTRKGDVHYLLITTRYVDDSEAAGFNTVVSEQFRGRSRSSSSRQLTILPIAKAQGNPYPDRISVGRARNCDVNIRDPSVSKLHAHFKVKPGGFELVDLESQNGTCVNGQPLASNRGETVSSGDVLLFGGVTCKLLNAGLLYDLFK
jgi:hypothetical protein